MELEERLKVCPIKFLTPQQAFVSETKGLSEDEMNELLLVVKKFAREKMIKDIRKESNNNVK